MAAGAGSGPELHRERSQLDPVALPNIARPGGGGGPAQLHQPLEHPVRRGRVGQDGCGVRKSKREPGQVRRQRSGQPENEIDEAARSKDRPIGLLFMVSFRHPDIPTRYMPIPSTVWWHQRTRKRGSKRRAPDLMLRVRVRGGPSGRRPLVKTAVAQRDAAGDPQAARPAVARPAAKRPGIGSPLRSSTSAGPATCAAHQSEPPGVLPRR